MLQVLVIFIPETVYCRTGLRYWGTAA